jgi:peptidoglycan/xylan/chitin deacetylase (PgdA/CDA1 family)
MYLLVLIFSLLILYCIIPDLWTRFFSRRVLKRGTPTKRYVFFTFDDGPHPEYTIEILKILQRYNLRATFFVLGKKVRSYPEVLEAIKRSGHRIGNHSYSHRFVWIMPPNLIEKEFEETDKVVKGIIEEEPSYIRPPWGGNNLALWKHISKDGKGLVLWSLDSKDWMRNISTDDIVRNVLEKVKPGDIILFHDGRWDDISKKTVEALPRIIEGLINRGYEIADISYAENSKEIVSLKSIFVYIWEIWERIYFRLAHIIELEDSESILHFSINTYRGKPLILKDGTLLERGDKFIELHLLNRKISDILGRHNSLMGASKEIERRLIFSIGKILEYIERNDIRVKAMHGVTVLYRLAEKKNFDIFDFNPFSRFFINIYEKFLLVVYHPLGFNRLKTKGRKLIPKSIWISLKSLKRYLYSTLYSIV